MRLLEEVDKYITDRDLHTVDLNHTVKQAREIMDKEETDSLIVLKNGNPKYVLKKIYIIGKDPSKKLESLLDEGLLRDIVVTERGSSYTSAMDEMAKRKASEIVVVESLRDNPQRIYGKISPQRQDFRQYASFSK